MVLTSRQLAAFVAASTSVHLFVLMLWYAPMELPLPDPPVVVLFDIQALAPDATAPPEPVAPPPPLSEPPPPEPEPIARPAVKPLPESGKRSEPRLHPAPKPKLVEQALEAPPPPLPASVTLKANPVAKARYEQQLFAWLNRRKNYPLVARRRGFQGRATVRIKVDRSGRVLANVLEAKSGYAILNDEALKMVKRADPFPPMPKGYAGETFEFLAPVDFALR